jgi:hypothetical protein
MHGILRPPLHLLQIFYKMHHILQKLTVCVMNLPIATYGDRDEVGMIKPVFHFASANDGFIPCDVAEVPAELPANLIQ